MQPPIKALFPVERARAAAVFIQAVSMSAGLRAQSIQAYEAERSGRIVF
jgi:hypothetical protein